MNFLSKLNHFITSVYNDDITVAPCKYMIVVRAPDLKLQGSEFKSCAGN